MIQAHRNKAGWRKWVKIHLEKFRLGYNKFNMKSYKKS